MLSIVLTIYVLFAVRSPEGVKIRSKPQLASYLGESFDLSAFDFRTGKLLSRPLGKGKRQKSIS